MMEGPGADSEEKREPVSDIDIAVADSLKVLDLNGRLEKWQDIALRR
jgi:acyl carrier protein